jgi:AcrR family transcriptional regulator
MSRGQISGRNPGAGRSVVGTAVGSAGCATLAPVSPARRDPAPGERSTPDALMDAALDRLNSKGVLAGLNLREVAEDVGVTRANIYCWFGSRQGLLRAELAREARRLEASLAEAGDDGFVDGRLRMLDAITPTQPLAPTALLALDGDPDDRPLPFLDSTRAYYQRLVEAGELPPDLDVEAAHLVALATSIRVAIYADAVARQLDVEVDGVRRRARAVFERMLGSLLATAGEPGAG